MSRRWIAILLLASSGCYRYAPIQGTPSDLGQPIRMRLTDQGSINLAPLIGPTIVTLDGSLVAVRDTLMVLSVTNAIARNGIETMWKGENVDVPKAAISGLQLRSLDKRRSWLLGVGGIAATAAIGAAFNLLGGGSGGKNGPVDGGPR
ncbi:MAG: hypothetical protein U0132_07140 [Gemmatimonadaceae bacterium]